MKLEIGQTVWYFDENRRVYRKKPGDLYSSGAPVWREHWTPYEVVGETSRSYIIGLPASSYRPFKISKKDVVEGTGLKGWAFSLEEIDQKAFVEQAVEIAEKIRWTKDYKTLRAVCDLIGFEPKTRVSE